MTTKRRPLRRKKGKLLIRIKSWEFRAPDQKWRIFQFETLNKILSVAKRSPLKARRWPRRRRTKWAWRTARSGTTTPRSPSVRGKNGWGLVVAAGWKLFLVVRMTSLFSAVKSRVGGRREKYSEGGESEVKLPVSID